MKTKTISDYALLIGELIRRAELRKTRRQRWSPSFFKINRSTSSQSTARPSEIAKSPNRKFFLLKGDE